jgi:putative ABC transport system substrate-binding protein
MNRFHLKANQSFPIVPVAKNRKRSRVITLIILIVFIVLFTSCDLRKTRVYRVGILSGMDAFLDITDGYVHKMTDLGYIEGKNIEYDMWKIDNDPVEEEKVIRKFIDDKVDLMLTFPTRATLKAKSLTLGTDIPVVFAGASIEGTDLVKNQREPGGNITGVRYPTPELTAKRLELLLELVPDVKRILIFLDLNYPTYVSARQAMDEVAINKNITFIECQVSTLEDIKSDLEAREKLNDIGVDALFFMPDLITSSPGAWDIIKPFVIKYHLPVASDMDYNLKDAGLFMLDSSHQEIGELAAIITDKILQGTSPGSISVASPNMNLHINYRRAQELGISIPEGLLKQAFKIIH